MSYIYSHQLKKYVALQPLTVSSRVIRAAKQVGVQLNWNQAGVINHLTFLQAKKLLEQLGSSFLSTEDYVILLRENLTQPDIYKKITSKEYTEWLDTVYYRDQQNEIRLINHPTIADNKIVNQSSLATNILTGRPAWFMESNFQDSIYPKKIVKNFVNLQTQGVAWKYWSPHRIEQWVGAIRGYVLSSDTLSLDMDIPLDAHQPSLCIREVRDNIETTEPSSQFLDNHKYLSRITDQFKSKLPQTNQPSINWATIRNILIRQLAEVQQMASADQKYYRELYLDLVGSIYVYHSEIPRDNLFSNLFLSKNQPDLTLSPQNLLYYLETIKLKLQQALENNSDIVLVMGHEHPDADAIIGAILEAYRLQFYEARTVVPVICGDNLPLEVIELLPKNIDDKLIYTDSDLYKATTDSGLGRWVLIDTYYHEYPKFIDGIIDHHILPDYYSQRQDIFCSNELAWNSILQIVYKYLAGGFQIDADMARLIIKATLLEADLSSLRKNMTAKDRCLWQQLLSIAGWSDDNLSQIYQPLMDKFLSVESMQSLFWRDYKQDLGNFGIAVIKLDNQYYQTNKQNIDNQISQLVDSVLNQQNLAAIIISLAQYDGINFKQGSFLIHLGKNRLPKLRQSLIRYIHAYILDYYRKRQMQPKIEITNTEVKYTNISFQLPRLLLGPGIARIISDLDRFFYSNSCQLYVSRTLATYQDLNFERGDINWITNVNYITVKKLLASQSCRLLTLTEYYQVLKDAMAINDDDMVRSLTSSDYTEFLDTVIVNNSQYIDQPCLEINDKHTNFKGRLKHHQIPYAHPGLMKLQDINPKTGLPNTILDPNRYAEENLWRFWAPDSFPAITVRGYIFLLLQPALDLKINHQEQHANLGFRLVYQDLIEG